MDKLKRPMALRAESQTNPFQTVGLRLSFAKGCSLCAIAPHR